LLVYAADGKDFELGAVEEADSEDEERKSADEDLIDSDDSN